MFNIVIVGIVIVMVCAVIFQPDKVSNPVERKEFINKFYSNFRMYYCTKNKIVFFPPKDISIEGFYYTLNLSVNSSILKGRSINGSGMFKNGEYCTECVQRCYLYDENIIDLKMNFMQFKEMDDRELEEHLRVYLPEKDYNMVMEKCV